MPKTRHSCIYLGQEIACYHFGAEHPFGPQRHDAFVELFYQRQLDKRLDILQPRPASSKELELFHDSGYIERVRQASIDAEGYLDGGDTPARAGIFEAASMVCGTTLDGIHRIMQGEYRRGFSPIAGLHHARRNQAAGFCVFNDCGMAIELLKQEYALQRIAYVDIDAHHGDGVFYSFVEDPAVVFADIHEDGRYLYPGTGQESETGLGAAQGTKLNLPMPMYADDKLFMSVWQKVEDFLQYWQPEFILFQCGADSIAGDPITHMQYSSRSHRHAATRLYQLAEQFSHGRLFAMGGGGYNLENLAKGWCAVVESLVEYDE